MDPAPRLGTIGQERITHHDLLDPESELRLPEKWIAECDPAGPERPKEIVGTLALGPYPAGKRVGYHVGPPATAVRVAGSVADKVYAVGQCKVPEPEVVFEGSDAPEEVAYLEYVSAETVIIKNRFGHIPEVGFLDRGPSLPQLAHRDTRGVIDAPALPGKE